jgi:small GTP-binding protein
MRQQPDNSLVCRVVTVGDAFVGKTSLVSQLISRTFRDSEPMTIGVNFREFSHRVEQTHIELQIWDTAGQEQYRALTPLYYRNAQAAIAVFAMDSAASFQSLSEQINVFLSIEPGGIVYVAANKADKGADERQVARAEAEAFARERGFPLFFTSAKTGDGVAELFHGLCEALYRRRHLRPSAAGPGPARGGAGCC